MERDADAARRPVAKEREYRSVSGGTCPVQGFESFGIWHLQGQQLQSAPTAARLFKMTGAGQIQKPVGLLSHQHHAPEELRPPLHALADSGIGFLLLSSATNFARAKHALPAATLLLLRTWNDNYGGCCFCKYCCCRLATRMSFSSALMARAVANYTRPPPRLLPPHSDQCDCFFHRRYQCHWR